MQQHKTNRHFTKMRRANYEIMWLEMQRKSRAMRFWQKIEWEKRSERLKQNEGRKSAWFLAWWGNEVFSGRGNLDKLPTQRDSSTSYHSVKWATRLCAQQKTRQPTHPLVNKSSHLWNGKIPLRRKQFGKCGQQKSCQCTFSSGEEIFDQAKCKSQKVARRWN